jgi:hypothetical protein
MIRLRQMVVLFIALTLSAVAAAVPTSFSIQGALRGQGGQAVDGTYSIVFALFTGETDNNLVWQEPLAIQVHDGLFSVILGTVVPIDPAVFEEHPELWLSVQVQGEGAMPRQPLLSQPFALLARRAEAANALLCTACIQPEHLGFSVVTPAELAVALGTLDYVTPTELSGALGAYATTSAVNNKLASYVTTSAISTTLEPYATTNALTAAVSDKVSTTTLTAALANYVTNTSLGTSLQPYAKTSELSLVAQSGSYPDLLNKPDLSVYAKTADLAAYATVASLSGYVAKNTAITVGATEDTCSATTEGVLRYVLAKKRLEVCNGTNWQAVMLPANGGTADQAGASCSSLKAGGITTDGAYWIDPNGGNTSDAFKVWCDMTTDGGGWTMVLRTKRSGSVFAPYYSLYWTNDTLLNETTDSNPQVDEDLKLKSWGTLSGTSIRGCLRHPTTGVYGCKVYSIAAQTIGSLFKNTPTNGLFFSEDDTAKYTWYTMWGQTTTSLGIDPPGYRQTGVNIDDDTSCVNARVRFGLALNNETTISTLNGTIGFGASNHQPSDCSVLESAYKVGAGGAYNASNVVPTAGTLWIR